MLVNYPAYLALYSELSVYQIQYIGADFFQDRSQFNEVNILSG